MGSDVRDWFVSVLARQARGSADLVAYFFLRAESLTTRDGTLGLIATNSIAQGPTREVGLDQMVEDGFEITRSIQSQPWPASSASLQFAAVWGTRAPVAESAMRGADGQPARRISSLLEPEGRVAGQPARLAENSNLCFQGCIILGDGFLVGEAQAREWINNDAPNADVLFPCVNGDDLNSRSDTSGSRWVIDFNDRSERAASRYAIPFSHVVDLVRPDREQNADRGAREYWWRFLRPRPTMREAIADLTELLVIALTSKTLMPVRVPSGYVFTHAVGVFATGAYPDQAVLSSSAHQMWAIKYGGGLKGDPRYAPTDVFEPFPRPSSTDRLASVGRTLDNERRKIMLRRDLGLTKLYNLVNDRLIADAVGPDVALLREIHVELDEAVMDAYGWSDVELDHGFHTYRQMERWTVSPAARVEILDRLLEENHRRAAAEAEQTKGSPKGQEKFKAAPKGMEELFS
jgi:hypothetical protein